MVVCFHEALYNSTIFIRSHFGSRQFVGTNRVHNRASLCRVMRLPGEARVELRGNWKHSGEGGRGGAVGKGGRGGRGRIPKWDWEWGAPTRPPMSVPSHETSKTGPQTIFGQSRFFKREIGSLLV